MEVTAKDAAGKDVASTNGLIAARYDVSHLTLQSVVVHADYQAVAQSDGTVKFAYADTGEIPAGSSVATLIFPGPVWGEDRGLDPDRGGQRSGPSLL